MKGKGSVIPSEVYEAAWERYGCDEIVRRVERACPKPSRLLEPADLQELWSEWDAETRAVYQSMRTAKLAEIERATGFEQDGFSEGLRMHVASWAAERVEKR